MDHNNDLFHRWTYFSRYYGWWVSACFDHDQAGVSPVIDAVIHEGSVMKIGDTVVLISKNYAKYVSIGALGRIIHFNGDVASVHFVEQLKVLFVFINEISLFASCDSEEKGDLDDRPVKTSLYSREAANKFVDNDAIMRAIRDIGKGSL